MLHFIAGFIIALVFVVPLLLLIYKRTSKNRSSRDENQKQLEQLSKLTGELTHEIKNPLSTIKVNLKLAAEELQSIENKNQTFQRAVRKIEVVQKESNRIEQILEGFLRYVDRVELQPTPLDINSLISDMVDFFSPQAHTNLITIRHQLAENPLICNVDEDMLKQVILNLFINAQHAMNSGGELIVKTDKRKDNAVIQISDTGVGIASDKLPHIFEPYFSSRSKGSGLGLPTAKRIVEQHNGNIYIDTELGKGTLFTIEIPLIG